MLPETAGRLEEARRLDREGQYGRAAMAYKLVLRADPGCLGAKVDLAGLLMILGRYEESLELSRAALADQPGHAPAVQNLVGALMGLDRHDEVEAQCRALLARDPGCAPAHLGLGMSLACRDRHLEAEQAFLRGLALAPGDAQLRGAMLRSQIKLLAWPRVYATWMEVAEKDMRGAKGLFEKAIIHLTWGELARGWELYEARLDIPLESGPRPQFGQPRWDGSAFPGRTLMVHWEQGFGDTLMFIRYAALARARGGRVLAVVQPELLPVLRGCLGLDGCYGSAAELPPFDLYAPLLSLPGLLGTRLDTIPAPVPYLRAPAGTCPAAASVRPSDNLKVGLVWAGNTVHMLDFMRTIPLPELAPLAAIPGVDWYSLQVGWQGGLPWPELCDLGPLLRDFGDTAQVLEQLDLLISVDTAVVHLAGALGRPAWVILGLVPDWRWLLEPETSAWYPSLRLFRARHHDRWDPVLAAIGDSLNQLMNARRGT